ncbi:MAPEG family protein [Rhodopseudomonas palustris]|uniref:MAPEG family protein n=1 Tax=Rhodopseudomonas palustris TaxID=1076 RepID=UPI002ACDE27C|nr:MAPEG family protein [Rhodopseudomonas palustris]WQH00429.1 MAPEG family protein [Rhodopseudomonas palustris]
MSVQMVLLPVFVLIGLTFALLLGTFWERRRALVSRETKIRDIALGQPNWPERATKVANCYRNQFELPILFYTLIAIGLPLRRIDLVLVLLSWVFVVTRFAHAGIFVSSNDLGQRSTAWFAGALVLLAMWVYFALRMLLLI